MEKNNYRRGTNEREFCGNIEVTCWKDNKPVYIASNKYDGETRMSCRRYSQVEKTYMNIPLPTMIQHYNEKIDLLDSMVATYYRVCYRKKKWWFYFYTWPLLVCSKCMAFENEKDWEQGTLFRTFGH